MSTTQTPTHRPTVLGAPFALPHTAAIVAAGLLGLALLAAVGFAHPQALHQATHDARHAAGFPCH